MMLGQEIGQVLVPVGRGTVAKSESPSNTQPVKKALDSRAALIDAALKTILERGIDAVRIDDIAKEVGVTKGSLYWHFEDRKALIKEALAEQVRRMSAETVDALSDAIVGTETKNDYLARIVPFIIDPFDKSQVLERWGRLGVLVETRNDLELKELMHDVQSRHLDVVVELMTQAQERRLLRDDLDPRAVAVALNVINLGSIIIDVLGDDAPTPEEWWKLIMFFIEQMFPSS